MEKVSAAMGVALMEPFLGTHVAIEQIRRVVTGYSADGKSVIASDTRVAGSVGPTKPNFTDFGVPTSCRPTRNDGSLALPDDFNWFPPPGGFRFARFVIPPNPALTTALIDQSVVGMHKSQAVDLLYIGDAEPPTSTASTPSTIPPLPVRHISPTGGAGRYSAKVAPARMSASVRDDSCAWRASTQRS
jgi:hypothetical protein